MILEIYALLFAISIGLIFLGYYSNIDVLKILGFGIIFMLGVVLLGYGETLQYHNTTTITEVNATLTTITPSYSNYTNKTYGFLFSTIAFFGWLAVYLNIRGLKNER